MLVTLAIPCGCGDSASAPHAAGAGTGGAPLGDGGAKRDGDPTGPAVDASPLGNSVGTLELYGTFHAMGVIATLPAGSDSIAAPASGDFTPAAGSPLIDRGLSLPGINNGYRGLAPDLGAVEAN